jgi:hypothetical protein
MNIYDVIKSIFDACDFTIISIKQMRLVSKQWKNVMDNNYYSGILGHIRESNIHHIRKEWSLQTWDYVSKYLVLKEWFVYEFSDKVNWDMIIEYQSIKYTKPSNIIRKEIPNVIIRYF